MDHASSEEAFANYAAYNPDFVSRLKGILNIKGLNPDTATDRSHIIRRAMLLRQLMVKSAPSICDSESGKVNVSGALLPALLRVSVYRHGARSLEYILAMCRLSGLKRFTPSSLPMGDQMDLQMWKISSASFSLNRLWATLWSVTRKLPMGCIGPVTWRNSTES